MDTSNSFARMLQGDDHPMASPSVHLSSSGGFLMSPPRTSQRKEKRNPSITPRRFGRFFTPRPGLSRTMSLPGRSALGDMTASAINRQPEELLQSSPVQGLGDPFSPSLSSLHPCRTLDSGPVSRKRPLASSPTPTPKRRELLHDGSELSTSNLIRALDVSLGAAAGSSIGQQPVSSADKPKSLFDNFFTLKRGCSQLVKAEISPLTVSDKASVPTKVVLKLEEYKPQPIVKLNNRGLAAQLLLREQGCMSQPGGQRHLFPVCDPRAEAANFYSRSTDLHMCNAHNGQGYTIPFSLASCHNESLTAIGDEEGYIRLFSTEDVSDPSKSKCDVIMEAHTNAIMDLSFSDDDLRLATACGDRSGKVIDVMSQAVALELSGGHTHSMRRVEFQPGPANGNILATSDRDGTIQIWDLRAGPGTANNFSTRTPWGVNYRQNFQPFWARTINTIQDAHARNFGGVSSTASVTAIQWLPSGREHLLLSASEANAVIKLWDTRYIKSRRQPDATPLCHTAEPGMHKWRSYGITSLALSGDAGRLYAVCKDSTAYVYSMAHLMLGHAPELSTNPPRKKQGTGQKGLAPLYGFKHENFDVKSFYVKCAIRKQNNGAELLAVGSSDKCAVLFPTDERYLWDKWDRESHTRRFDPAFTDRTPVEEQAFQDSNSAVAIVRNGVPLIRGHTREVTTVDWSNQGKLITSSDDYIVRHWQESRHDVHDLRTCGEFGGKRHLSGWADVGEDWDEDDDAEE